MTVLLEKWEDGGEKETALVVHIKLKSVRGTIVAMSGRWIMHV